MIIFYKKGKSEEVFKALEKAVLIEERFGRLIEPLEPGDFSKN